MLFLAPTGVAHRDSYDGLLLEACSDQTAPAGPSGLQVINAQEHACLTNG